MVEFVCLIRGDVDVFAVEFNELIIEFFGGCLEFFFMVDQSCLVPVPHLWPNHFFCLCSLILLLISFFSSMILALLLTGSSLRSLSRSSTRFADLDGHRILHFWDPTYQVEDLFEELFAIVNIAVDVGG